MKHAHKILESADKQTMLKIRKGESKKTRQFRIGHFYFSISSKYAQVNIDTEISVESS